MKMSDCRHSFDNCGCDDQMGAPTDLDTRINPHDFELRRVNQQWFMDLVTDAALMGAALGIRGAERAA